MATSTIFNFNFNNSEIVDSTGQWYDATTGTPTTEFINHDGNTALLQRAYIAGTPYLRDINPVFFQSRDPTFTAHTYTIELQIYPLRDSGRFGPETGPVLDFNPATNDAESMVQLRTIQYGSASNTFYWKERYLGLDGDGIPFLTVTAADGTYNRWYSIRIERVDDGTNTGATIKIYVDGALVVNETLTYAQDARIGRIGDSIRYTYRRNSTSPMGAGVAIDNFKLTAGIAPSSVVDVSLANLQRNNANLLSFIKGKVPAVNDGTLTIQKNGTNVATFTANASTNATANIQCVDLTNNQTVGGNKEFTGTTTAHDLVPSATDTYNFGSSSYQWNNLYAKNYYYNGTAWGLDKANQWGADNKFTGNVSIEKSNDSPTTLSDTSLALTGTSQYIFFRTKGSANYKSYNSFLWGGYLTGASPYRFGRIRLYRASAIYGEPGDETPDTSFSFIDVALHYKWVSLTDNVKFINDETTNACAPLTNNATDLGTSTNKWKSFNGINPGALSLPSISSSGANAWIALDTTDWVKSVATSTAQKYTPPADGWLNIRVDNATTLGLAITGGANYLHQMVRSETPNSLALLMPVFKNTEVAILVAGNENLAYNRATFYYCQGNV